MNRKKKQTETPEELRPFEFHGIDFTLNGSQAVADCPFCQSPKFFINKDTGQCDCKKCGFSGNKYSFMGRLHQEHLKLRTDQDVKRIRKLRDNCFSSDFIRSTELCFNDDGSILIPHIKPGKKNPSNLRRWSPKTKILYNTPGSSTLYYRWDSKGDVVFLCEGEWDALSLHQLMIRAKYKDLDKCSIVASPGANVFKETWIPFFKGKHVYVLYDNDDQGRQGQEKVADVLADHAASVSLLDWKQVSTFLPEKYDLRDHLSEAIKSKKSKLHLRKLLAATKPVARSSNKQIVALKRTSFDQVVKDFQERLEFNQSFVDVLACCFASLITLYMSHQKRNPLWLFIVAPASSGKTTIIECFDAVEKHTRQVSKLTPASLVTGLNINDDYDPSLLSELRNCVLFVKDFTPVLTMGGDKEQIFGILRDAYDGAYIARYAGGVREYKNLYFGIVAGVTHAIERVNMSDLGERFIRIRLLDDNFDEISHIEKALDNVDIQENQPEHTHYFQGSVLGYTQHLMANLYQPVYPERMNRRLAPLAQFAALCRTEVPRSQSREMYYRPSPEVASRIATQLKKLGLGLALVYGKQEVDQDCYRVMQKVAFDSCVGWKLELIQVLDRTDDGMMIKTISDKMQVHHNQVRKIIEDCQQLGMVEHLVQGNTSGNRGSRVRKYRISDNLKRIMKRAGISFYRKPKTRTKSRRTKRKL